MPARSGLPATRGSPSGELARVPFSGPVPALREKNLAVFPELPDRVVGHPPEVTIRIGEVPTVASPRGGLRRFHGPSAPFPELDKDHVDRTPTPYIVGERHAPESTTPGMYPSLLRQRFLPEEPEHQSVQLEERDGIPLGVGSPPSEDVPGEADRPP